MVRFRPDSSVVKMYVCGPTPYDRLHLGHARTFIFFDVLARMLRRWGFTLNFIINFSDIADEVIERARRENTSSAAIAKRFSEYCVGEMRSIHVVTPTAFPPASTFVPQAIRLVEQLIGEGWAYEAGGAVFFNSARSRALGWLSKAGRELQGLRRYDLRVGKRDPSDFILWERVDDEPGWESPFGRGRPGWHLQDVSIAQAAFSGPYHIHGGAVELAYPHHECQEMLGQACTHATPYVQNWVHVGLVTLGGRKMSKSRQNVLYVHEAVERWGADAVRLALLTRPQLEPLEALPHLFDRARAVVQEIREMLVSGWGRAGGDAGRISEAAYQLLTYVRTGLHRGLDPDTLLQYVEALSSSREGVKGAIPALEILGLEDCLKAIRGT